eukprot:6197690-Pleurochrysis_carterae.AAC.5
MQGGRRKGRAGCVGLCLPRAHLGAGRTAAERVVIGALRAPCVVLGCDGAGRKEKQGAIWRAASSR